MRLVLGEEPGSDPAGRKLLLFSSYSCSGWLQACSPVETFVINNVVIARTFVRCTRLCKFLVENPPDALLDLRCVCFITGLPSAQTSSIPQVNVLLPSRALREAASFEHREYSSLTYDGTRHDRTSNQRARRFLRFPTAAPRHPVYDGGPRNASDWHSKLHFIAWRSSRSLTRYE